jgi:hypothetical protein
MQRIFRFDLPLFPFLFVIYPILHLWNTNRGHQPAYVLVPILAASLLSVALLYGLAFTLTRDHHRAALLISVLSFYILTFGHLHNLVSQWNQGLLQPYLLPVSAIMVLFGLVVIGKRQLGSADLTKVLNMATAGLVLFQLVSATPYFLRATRFGTTTAQAVALPNSIPLTGRLPSPQRDIYFILVDNYGREDILKQGSGFDNSQMVNELMQRGFIFPNCAQSNYFWTAPAVSSILNIDYLETLGINENSYNRRGHYDDMAPLIEESLVVNKFRAYGYHVVTFRGFMGLIDIQDSDTYVSFDNDPSYNRMLAVARFRELFYQTTLFSQLDNLYSLSVFSHTIPEEPLIDHQQTGSSSDVLEPQFDEIFQQNHYALEALTRIPKEVAGPKFVYAHLYSAHWPFMTRPDGSLRLPFTQQMTTPGYVDAVKFTNDRLLAAIDSILTNSKTKPVIILQGDHSNEWIDPVEWSGEDRLKILSAYFLPDDGDRLLYDTISPVNTFRLIFQHYFGENIPLLPDNHYFLNPTTRQVDIAPISCMDDVKPTAPHGE